ncbi:hypothetical protein J2T57_004184 [Natronocella acetinitrilica]|uniref:DUF3293 domain-containing protein n=1 Tax=Natronocella acetinitrilica TaxID=414046 RepID=A0AAE3G735_9GAMM|nr:DUF3293 domain-containing protein [Natronocella acetinitrilica]MCP1677010.1 hypothetical protein [Natronocella acetinitrilica]
MSESQIASDLQLAYRNTLFRVDGSPDPFTIRIGERSPEMDQLFDATGTRWATLITAYNPYSHQASPGQNEFQNGRLAHILTILSRKVVTANGEVPDGDWPAEPSLLAVGLAPADGRRLGAEFCQNAVVEFEIYKPARLALLR